MSAPADPLRADRLARVALARLSEPGDPRMCGLVAELGATRVQAHLAAERDVGGMLTDVAARLGGLEGAARRAFIRDEIKRREDQLVTVGVPRNLARGDARALVAAAEAALTTTNKGGSAA